MPSTPARATARSVVSTVVAGSVLAALAVAAPAASAREPGTWRAVDVPVDDMSLLHDVAAVAGDDAWAVGLRRTSTQTPLAVHWDGVDWRAVTTDPAAKGQASFVGVDATAPDDVWAVGSSLVSSRAVTRVVTHAQHWDGRRWSVVPTPDVGRFGGNGSLADVDARTRTDAWAVGFSLGPGGGESQQAMIARWNGRRWTLVPAADAGGALTELRGVSAVGSSLAWAVGSALTEEGSQPLVQRWDGRAWSRVALPDLPGGTLNDVVATASDDVWAVGGLAGRPLALHFDGTAWTTLTPDVRSPVAWLRAVDVDDDGTVHAVGQALGPDDLWQPLLLSGTGTDWRSVELPEVPGDDMLYGIDVTGPTGFAVGERLTRDEVVPELALVLQRAG
jgi:hypothetical protein